MGDPGRVIGSCPIDAQTIVFDPHVRFGGRSHVNGRRTRPLRTSATHMYSHRKTLVQGRLGGGRWEDQSAPGGLASSGPSPHRGWPRARGPRPTSAAKGWGSAWRLSSSCRGGSAVVTCGSFAISCTMYRRKDQHWSLVRVRAWLDLAWSGKGRL